MAMIQYRSNRKANKMPATQTTIFGSISSFVTKINKATEDTTETVAPTARPVIIAIPNIIPDISDFLVIVDCSLWMLSTPSVGEVGNTCKQLVNGMIQQ